jgi:poly-gamma-glutamate synthesis protein (capsule biosynthesis protein)
VKAGRFDVACCANNHVGDYGPAEALKTVQICHDHGIKTVGAGRDLAAARKPLFVERGGICLALLAFAENEFGIAREDAAGSNPLNPLRNIEDIRGAVKRADVTVVLVHGGNEYNPVPSPRMVQTYRAFADAGAAAVIAGHPHCPQGIEVWNGKPIVYSPGNFLFDWQRGAPNRFWWMGYMVRITLARGKACALEVVPYTFGPSAERVVLLRGNERKSFLAYVQHLSHIIPDEEEVRRYWDAWCAMQGPGVLKFLCGVTWPPDPNQEGAVRKLLSTRNIFTCEAHDDLARGFLMMAVEGRVEAGSAYVPRTKALQSGQIPA